MKCTSFYHMNRSEFVDISKHYNVILIQFFMSGKRYSEEFKIEGVQQVTELNFPIG